MLPRLVVFTLVTLTAGSTYAQEPKFEFGKKEDVKEVEWKASAKLGLLLTSGNSQTTTLTAGTSLSRKAAANKFSFDAGLAYAQSDVLLAIDANGNGVIDPGEYSRVGQTTANSWFTKGRYDRFLTANNSAYLMGSLAADQIAGKELVGGLQVGYSRRLFKNDWHETVAELGYDFSYESYTASDLDSVAIHSARVFLGQASKVTPTTAVTAQVEALFNLNTESKALRPSGMGAVAGVDAFDDTRVNAKVGLTTTLWKNIAFTFSYTIRYDHAPAPLPEFKLKFADGFRPFAETLDTLAEAALVVNFL
jgi:putative salt-induced outer membrane protein YdiY